MWLISKFMASQTGQQMITNCPTSQEVKTVRQ